MINLCNCSEQNKLYFQSAALAAGGVVASCAVVALAAAVAYVAAHAFIALVAAPNLAFVIFAAGAGITAGLTCGITLMKVIWDKCFVGAYKILYPEQDARLTTPKPTGDKTELYMKALGLSALGVAAAAGVLILAAAVSTVAMFVLLMCLHGLGEPFLAIAFVGGIIIGTIAGLATMQAIWESVFTPAYDAWAHALAK